MTRRCLRCKWEKSQVAQGEIARGEGRPGEAMFVMTPLRMTRMCIDRLTRGDDVLFFSPTRGTLREDADRMNTMKHIEAQLRNGNWSMRSVLDRYLTPR